MDKDELFDLHELASSGQLDAISELVNNYLQAHDYKKAFLTAQRFEFFKSAQGYKTLGHFYQKGIGTEIDLNKAKDYYEKSFDLGDITSGYNLALMEVRDKNFQKAIKYLTSGVEANHLNSIRLLANLYLNGDGLYQDKGIAISLLEKGMSLGDNKALIQLAKIYYLDKNYQAAKELFEKGSQLGDLDCIYHLGLFYAKGLGVRQDFSQAVKYYQMGAKELEPRCLYNLSLYYRNGVVVEQNIELANKLENQAIERGFKK